MTRTKRTHNRKNHFLRRSYLNGFEHPYPENRKKPLWVFDVRTLKWNQKSSAQIGHAWGFYDYPPESIPDATADGVFVRLENDFPQAREAIRREGYESWTRHRDVLVSFAAMLTARSPLFRIQASSEILPSLANNPQGKVLAKNYAITNMRMRFPGGGGMEVLPLGSGLHQDARSTGNHVRSPGRDAKRFCRSKGGVRTERCLAGVSSWLRYVPHRFISSFGWRTDHGIQRGAPCRTSRAHPKAGAIFIVSPVKLALPP